MGVAQITHIHGDDFAVVDDSHKVLGIANATGHHSSYHDSEDLLGGPYLGFGLIFESFLYPFLPSKVVLEVVLDDRAVCPGVYQFTGLAAYVCLELSFKHVAQLRCRAEPCLISPRVEVIGLLGHKPHSLRDWMTQHARIFLGNPFYTVSCNIPRFLDCIG